MIQNTKANAKPSRHNSIHNDGVESENDNIDGGVIAQEYSDMDGGSDSTQRH